MLGTAVCVRCFAMLQAVGTPPPCGLDAVCRCLQLPCGPHLPTRLKAVARNSLTHPPAPALSGPVRTTTTPSHRDNPNLLFSMSGFEVRCVAGGEGGRGTAACCAMCGLFHHVYTRQVRAQHLGAGG